MLRELQVIAEKLLDYLRSATDDGQKAEVAQRIGELAERFAPDTQWFIDTMNQVSQCALHPGKGDPLQCLSACLPYRPDTPVQNCLLTRCFCMASAASEQPLTTYSILYCL